MRYAGPRARRLATGPRAATAPGAEVEDDLSRATAHLDWADIIERQKACQAGSARPTALVPPACQCLWGRPISAWRATRGRSSPAPARHRTARCQLPQLRTDSQPREALGVASLGYVLASDPGIGPTPGPLTHVPGLAAGRHGLARAPTRPSLLPHAPNSISLMSGIRCRMNSASFFFTRDSIWRTRSRVMPNSSPISWSVTGSSSRMSGSRRRS
jgi:hypothetical protein